MRKLNFLDWIAMILLVVGGLNWGLIGFFGFDLVAALVGDGTLSARLIYMLVGLAALYGIIMPTIFGREECIPPRETVRGSV